MIVSSIINKGCGLSKRTLFKKSTLPQNTLVWFPQWVIVWIHNIHMYILHIADLKSTVSVTSDNHKVTHDHHVMLVLMWMIRIYDWNTLHDCSIVHYIELLYLRLFLNCMYVCLIVLHIHSKLSSGFLLLLACYLHTMYLCYNVCCILICSFV